MNKNNRENQNGVKEWILSHPANFFIISAIIIFFVLWQLDIADNNFSWHDILVEAHGLFYDLIVFGIVLSLYEVFKHRKEQSEKYEIEKLAKIKRYREELDDYRGWKSKQAAYRVAGIIRRLQKEGVKEINFLNLHLGKCDQGVIETVAKTGLTNDLNLKNALIDGVDLQNVDLKYSDFQTASLGSANLQNANLMRVNFQNSYLGYANLQAAYLGGANLKNADLKNANLTGANLENTKLEGANLTGTNLNEVRVSQVNWIEKLTEWNVIGAEEIDSYYYVDPTLLHDDLYPHYYRIKEKK